MSDGLKKKPEGVDVQWVTSEIGWEIPTWIEPELYELEFKDEDPQVAGQLLTHMFNYLAAKLRRLAATGQDVGTVQFKYWRKLSDKATKMKPTKLRATLYKHPDYDKPWMLVEAA